MTMNASRNPELPLFFAGSGGAAAAARAGGVDFAFGGVLWARAPFARAASAAATTLFALGDSRAVAGDTSTDFAIADAACASRASASTGGDDARLLSAAG